MPNAAVDKNHCYECGKEEVVFGSLYPLEPIYGASGIVNNGAGSASAFKEDRSHIPPVKFNIDFNVCNPCYAKQHKRKYPDMEVPVKIRHLRRFGELREQFRKEQELENARAVIARHEKEA